MSAAYDIARHIGVQGLGQWAATSGWGIYCAEEPAAPDSVITVYDTGGRDPLLYGEDVRQPTIQVRVRSHSYLDAYAKHRAIADAMHQIFGRVIDTHFYVGVWMTGDIISLGRDGNDRYRLTANYQITRKPQEA